VLCPIAMAHVRAFPEHAPPQPRNVLPAGGMAVRVTTAPCVNLAEQGLELCGVLRDDRVAGDQLVERRLAVELGLEDAHPRGVAVLALYPGRMGAAISATSTGGAAGWVGGGGTKVQTGAGTDTVLADAISEPGFEGLANIQR